MSSRQVARSQPILLDIGPLEECKCDGVLEELFKAAALPAEHDTSIWATHPNPWLVEHVEDVTRRLQVILQRMQDALAGILLGEPIGELKKALDPWLRWDQAQFDAARDRLEGRPPSSYTLDDWLLLIDFIVQRYLPDDVINYEALYLAIRATLLGKIQSALETPRKPNRPEMAAISMLVPTAFAHIPPRVLTPLEMQVLHVSHARAAQHISNVSNSARARMKEIVIEHVQAQILGQKDGQYTALQTRLFDEFGQLNRDFRRIAVTEAGECCNQGFIAAQRSGQKVRRQEAYAGACEFCRSISGKVFEVVDPAAKTKNGETQVWLGKTNVGRSASPRMRVGNTLMERGLNQRWWVAAGVIHPHCFVNGDLPVYTSEGWKPISSIAVGDSVLTHKGRFRPVTWVLEGVTHTGLVHGAVTSFGGRNVAKLPMSTGEHPILTARGWVPSSELVAGDKLVALAKVCPTCEKPFVNAKFPHVQYCCVSCTKRAGTNQFSTEDPEKLAAAKAVTGEANTRRLRGMTVEQRAALTEAGRAAMRERGYAHLADIGGRKRGGQVAASKNYRPSEVEATIARSLASLGCNPALQHRVEKTTKDSLGRPRYWWLDIAIPEQRIAVEIDGEPWHGRLSGGRDDPRDDDLRSQGWTVLRFDAKRAAADPVAIAEEVARVAMNHDGAYVFGHLDVELVTSRKLVDARLYNFAVEEDESYVVGGGFVVHNCRGSWTSVSEAPPAVSPAFEAWLDDLIAKAK